MDQTIAIDEKLQIKLISKRSDDYKLEFINGAISNVTPRGEIVCDFHFESRDRPTEQFVEPIAKDGSAKLIPFKDTGIITRDVKFGIIINVPFAKDLVTLLNNKIAEIEAITAKKELSNTGEHK